MNLINNKWVEFSSESGFAFTFQPWSYYDQKPLIHINLPCKFNLFVHLPIRTGISDYCETPEFGVYWHYQSLIFCFAMKRFHFDMPWSWKLYKHWERINRYTKGTYRWVEVPSCVPSGLIADKETHDYTYKLKSGEIQNRKATIYVSRREWRMKWFMFLPKPAKVQIALEIEFDGEVGERTGSWKGGTIGCGYKMNPNESMLSALRRMELERKF